MLRACWPIRHRALVLSCCAAGRQQCAQSGTDEPWLSGAFFLSAAAAGWLENGGFLTYCPCFFVQRSSQRWNNIRLTSPSSVLAGPYRQALPLGLGGKGRKGVRASTMTQDGKYQNFKTFFCYLCCGLASPSAIALWSKLLRSGGRGMTSKRCSEWHR